MATEKPQAGEEIPSQNGGSDNGAEGRQIVVDLNDNDVLYTRGYVCHGYRCFQNVVEEFRGKAAKAKKIRDVAREALAAFEARYPTSRFVTKTRKNDYVLTERKRIIAKFAYAFNYAKDDEPDDVFGGLQDGAAIAALAELQPSKRNRRPSKRMAEFNEATAKKGKKRRKRSKDHNTSGFLSIENHQHSSVAEPKPEPRGLGELALKFMRWAFTSKCEELDLETAAESLRVPRERILDLLDILEGAGLLERDADGSQLGWLTPCVGSPQEFRAAFVQEEQLLTAWIDGLKNAQLQGAIDRQDLAPLVRRDSKYLVIHAPKGSRLSSVNLPPSKFKIISPPSLAPKLVMYEIHHDSSRNIMPPGAAAAAIDTSDDLGSSGALSVDTMTADPDTVAMTPASRGLRNASDSIDCPSANEITAHSIAMTPPATVAAGLNTTHHATSTSDKADDTNGETKVGTPAKGAGGTTQRLSATVSSVSNHSGNTMGLTSGQEEVEANVTPVRRNVLPSSRKSNSLTRDH